MRAFENDEIFLYSYAYLLFEYESTVLLYVLQILAFQPGLFNPHLHQLSPRSQLLSHLKLEVCINLHVS